MSKGFTRRYRGHLIHVTEDTERGVTAIRFDITSDTGQGAAVGHYGWHYGTSLNACAAECEKLIDVAIAGDEAKLAGSAVS